MSSYNIFMPNEKVSAVAIYQFIENRWHDAREKLEGLDSVFVHALEVQDSVKDKGLWLPYDLP